MRKEACPGCYEYVDTDYRTCPHCGYTERPYTCSGCEYYTDDSDCDGYGEDVEYTCIKHYDDEIWPSKPACIFYVPEVCD